MHADIEAGVVSVADSTVCKDGMRANASDNKAEHRAELTTTSLLVAAAAVALSAFAASFFEIDFAASAWRCTSERFRRPASSMPTSFPPRDLTSSCNNWIP